MSKKSPKKQENITIAPEVVIENQVNKPTKKDDNSYEKALKDSQSSGLFKTVFNFKKTYPAFILLIFAIAASFFVRSTIKSNIDNDQKNSYDKAVSLITNRLEQNYNNYEQVVVSMKNLLEKTYPVRDIFELNASVPTSTNKAIKIITFVKRVQKSDLEKFTYNTMSQGYFDFKLKPETQKDVYYITEYFYPYDNNAEYSGLDFGENKSISSYFTEAIKENKVFTSEFTEIKKDTLGFYIAIPVYSKDKPSNSTQERELAFNSFIIMELKAKDFLDYVFVTEKAKSDETLVFDIEDNGKKIYKSSNHNLNGTYTPLIQDSKTIKFANREIKVNFATIPNFAGSQEFIPLISFIGSLGLSFVLFAFVVSVITSRARAVDLAERITRDQRRIVEASQDIIAVLSTDGIWKSMNPASIKIFNLEPNAFIGTDIKGLFFNDEGNIYFSNLINRSENEYTDRVDLQMKTNDGSVKWINWSFTLSKLDKLIYAIGRDVTLEKIAEEEAKLRNKQVTLAEQFSREASESKTYFMIKLGHQIRNSLTGIVGYLQLISGKVYDTEEELDNFVALAEESTDELFTFTSDLLDRSEQEEKEANISMEMVNFNKVLELAEQKLKQYVLSGVDIKVNIDKGEKVPHMVADENILSEAIVKVYDALSSGLSECKFDLIVNENSHEGATEIQIVGSPNALVEELINIFKENKNNLIDALKHDKRDVLLDLAIVESNIKRMFGTMKVDSLGKEGNLVMLTLPMNQQNNH